MQKKFEISLIFLFAIFAIYCSLSIGSSWDQDFVMTRGEERLKYLLSFGVYSSDLLWNRDTEDMLPGFFATFATLIKKMFPYKYEVESWHLINTTFSFLTFFGIYRITSILFNKQVGKIVFLFCFLNPIFFGHMAINSKDTIVALSNVWATYFFLKYITKQNLKNNCYKYVFLFALALGLGAGTRVAFPATLLPLLTFSLIDIFFLKKISNINFSFKKFISHFAIVLVIAYFFVISCWPHVHSNIITGPFNKLLLSMNLEWMPWMLFDGTFYSTHKLPLSYLFVSFFYKSPEFILATLIIAFYLLAFKRDFFIKNFNNFWIKISLILLIILFPAFFFIMQPYNIYDGIRLFLYVVPYYNIIPGLVIYYLLNNYRFIIPKTLLYFVSVLFVYYIYIFIIISPYHYTYLNIFTGKYSNAYEKFENDYWATSTKELVNKIKKKSIFNNPSETIKITFCGAPHSLVKDDLKSIKNLNYEEGDINSNDFEYVIMTNRAIFKDKEKYAKNVKTCFQKYQGKDLVAVKRNGLVLSILRKKNN